MNLFPEMKALIAQARQQYPQLAQMPDEGGGGGDDSAGDGAGERCG